LAAPKKVPAVFYRTEMGTEPVREWLKSLSAADRKIIGADLQTIEYGWHIGMPTCRSLGGGLWELRSTITNGIARIIFVMHEGTAILLNGFVKKTQKTPDAEIDLAKKRKRNVETEARK
jgi:phage-related protein